MSIDTPKPDALQELIARAEGYADEIASIWASQQGTAGLIRELCAALRSLSSTTSAWQPFATAPDDGQTIIAWREDAGVFTAHACWADDLDDGRYTLRQSNGDEPCWFTAGGEDLTNDLPTLWMPLPSHPTAGVPASELVATESVSASSPVVSVAQPTAYTCLAAWQAYAGHGEDGCRAFVAGWHAALATPRGGDTAAPSTEQAGT